jgi:hypothetical protein
VTANIARAWVCTGWTQPTTRGVDCIRNGTSPRLSMRQRLIRPYDSSRRATRAWRVALCEVSDAVSALLVRVKGVALLLIARVGFERMGGHGFGSSGVPQLFVLYA